MAPIKSLHLTSGGPWHGVHTARCVAWLSELRTLLEGKNPCASAGITSDGASVVVDVEFSKPKPRG